MAKRVAVVILTAVLLASATSAEAKKQTKAKAAEERLRKSCAECTKIAANFERGTAAPLLVMLTASYRELREDVDKERLREKREKKKKESANESLV